MTTNLVIILIIFQIIRIESLFVSVGNYSNESIPGLNGPECGLRVKPIVFDLSLNNKCFRRKTEDKTIVLFDKPKVKPQINQRIWNGVDVRHVNESAWVVFIGTTHWFSDAGTCTGVLITPYWVLTAAHCYHHLKDMWMTGAVVTMGSNTRKGIKKIEFNPESFISHPGYKEPYIPGTETFYYDIALIRISGFFPTTSHHNKYLINSICLPKRDQINEVYENASFYGYGIINDNQDIPEYLQMGWVILKPSRECSNYSHLCGDFIDANPRICQGDSGGPLVQFIAGVEKRAVLLGTLSTGGPGLACSIITKYAKWIPVSKHIDWILKTIKENP